MSTIRSLFSARRSIDRPIEKVIDYYATDESRLEAEVEEYEVTDNVERCFRKFLETKTSGPILTSLTFGATEARQICAARKNANERYKTNRLFERR